MRNRALLFAFLAMFASLAQAGESQVTPIEGADIVCQVRKNVFSINTVDQRVWHSKNSQNEGMEYQVLSWKQEDCPDCFLIQAQVTFLGETARLQWRTGLDSAGKLLLTITGTDGDGNEKQVAEAPCNK